MTGIGLHSSSTVIIGNRLLKRGRMGFLGSLTLIPVFGWSAEGILCIVRGAFDGTWRGFGDRAAYSARIQQDRGTFSPPSPVLRDYGSGHPQFAQRVYPAPDVSIGCLSSIHTPLKIGRTLFEFYFSGPIVQHGPTDIHPIPTDFSRHNLGKEVRDTPRLMEWGLTDSDHFSLSHPYSPARGES